MAVVLLATTSCGTSVETVLLLFLAMPTPVARGICQWNAQQQSATENPSSECAVLRRVSSSSRWAGSRAAALDPQSTSGTTKSEKWGSRPFPGGSDKWPLPSADFSPVCNYSTYYNIQVGGGSYMLYARA